MSKTLNGVVISAKRENLVTVEVTWKVPHPKYRKLMARSKKFSVALQGKHAKIGDKVVISETRPISKTVHFVVSKVNTNASK